VKPEKHENHVIDIDETSDEFNYLDELPEAQEFLGNMNLEVSTSNDVTQLNWSTTNTPFTKGITLEITVALKLFSDGDVKFKLLHRALVDTGCTKSLIKRNRLPDDFFKSWKVTNVVSWTTNAGKFGTKYNIPLQFTLPEFTPTSEIT
jgi:hypothetical protein